MNLVQSFTVSLTAWKIVHGWDLATCWDFIYLWRNAKTPTAFFQNDEAIAIVRAHMLTGFLKFHCLDLHWEMCERMLKSNWQKSLGLLLVGYWEYTVLPWLHWDPSGKLKWYVNPIYHPDYIFMWVRVCDYWQAVGPTLTYISSVYHSHHVHICLNIYR